jgi:undecaprenyl-diphosphatase
MLQFLQSIVTYIGDHPHSAFIIVFLIAAGEAIFVLGLFVPSTVVIVGAGTLIGMGKLAPVPVFAATALGAIAGDALSYWIGHAYKEHIRSVWPFSRYTGMLDKGEAYFDHHGGKSVFLGRFIPGIKSVVPGIAGIVGMSPWRFTVINIVSAVVWAAVHLLPGIGIGRGIDVAKSGNPRLLELLIVSALAAGAAWYLAKFAFFWLLPHAERWHGQAISALAQRQTPRAALLRRLLENENNILVAFFFASLALLALSGFAMVLAQYLFDPEFVRSDTAISAYLQSLRTPVFNEIMTGITMLGDGVVLTPVAAAVIAALIWHKRWKLSGAVLTAFVSAALFVPLFKSLIHRARPMALYSGADSYSFPSGHATLSATIIGITALIAARDFEPRIRRWIYLGTASAVGLIAFSRLYLFAHWPSDVGAGLLFGGTLVFLLAYLLHDETLVPISKRTAALAAIVLTISYPFHLYTGYATALSRYELPPTEKAISRKDWLSGAWNAVDSQRVLLDGEFGEPILVQTDMDLARAIEKLQASGWSITGAGRILQIADAILPARAPLDQMSVLPLTNSGKPPLAALTSAEPDTAEKRLVLRFWDSGVTVAGASGNSPLLLISTTMEVRDPLPFGYAVMDAAPMTSAESAALAASVSAALGENAIEHDANVGKLFLVPEPQ